MINLLTSFFIKDSYCYTQLVVNQVYVSISLLLYSHIPTAIVSLLAGLFLLFKSKKLETKIFFFLTLAFFLFTLGDLTEWFVFFGRDTVMFARSIIEVVDPLLFILSSYFLFVLIKKRDVRLIYKVLWFLPLVPLIVRAAYGYNLSGYNWDICEVIESPFSTNYIYYIDLFYMFSAIFFAAWSIIKSKDNRKEVSIASAGVCLFIILFFVMEYVFTGYIFGSAFDYNYFVYAFFGMPILIVFLGYLIIKYNEFDIKLVATQALIWALIALIGAQFFFIKVPINFVLTGVTFFAVIIFGQLLIKSVKKEIQQREKIEKIEKELEKAYAVEKKANNELKELDNVKNQFLMTIQHHLRTPLTSMRGYSDLLLNGTFGKVPKKIEEVIKKFESSTTSLIKMVNDFLDVTQFQLGKGVVSLKDGVNLSVILEDAVKDAEIEATNKKIYLKLEKPKEDCIIKADESKIKAALVNIFDNAIKYTDEGGVTVSLKADGGKVKIEIKDTGMGISKERLPKLFDSIFERTDESKKSFAVGRGVGLYLSSQIIKAHNGKIWAESEGENKGSTFFIELPVTD